MMQGQLRLGSLRGDDGLGGPAGFGEEAKVDGEGVPALERHDDRGGRCGKEAKVDGNGTPAEGRSHTTDRRRGGRWAMGRRAWFGAERHML